VFSAEFGYHGGRRGDAMRALARWRHPVASSEAQDVLHWEMRPAIETASDSPAFFVVVDLLFAHNVS